MRMTLLLLFSLLVSTLVSAREWQGHDIPDSYCGNGEKYKAFVSYKNSKKWAIVFQGGGACWDYLTCSTEVTTKLGAHDKVEEVHGIMSDNSNISPLHDYSMVFLPYCTGDLFAGDHIANYLPLKNIHHRGKRNVVNTLNYFESSGLTNLKQTEDFVLYGASAGALGIVFNLKWIDETFINVPKKKIVILDGMGLHWNDNIFKRFSNMMISEITKGFDSLNIPFDPQIGLLAQYASEACQAFPDYHVAFLQGSKDIVMSLFFGFMNPLSHQKKVYGEGGIFKETEYPFDNCQAWVPKTYQHTFMDGLRKGPNKKKTSDGISAMEFVKRLFMDTPFRPNYR